MLISRFSLARSIVHVFCVLMVLTFLTNSFAATNTTQTVDDDTKSNDDNNDGQGLGPTVVLLFMFIGLSLGIIVMQILSVVGEVSIFNYDDFMCIIADVNFRRGYHTLALYFFLGYFSRLCLQQMVSFANHFLISYVFMIAIIYFTW